MEKYELAFGKLADDFASIIRQYRLIFVGILTHWCSDADEVITTFLLYQFGDVLFPGVKKAILENRFYLSTDGTIGKKEDCTPWTSWELFLAGIICMSRGDDNPLNDHNNGLAEEGYSSARIFSWLLKLQTLKNWFAIKMFVDYADRCDGGNAGDRNSLGHVLKSLYNFGYKNGRRMSQVEVIRWGLEGLIAKYERCIVKYASEQDLKDCFDIEHLASLMRKVKDFDAGDADAWLKIAVDALALEKDHLHNICPEKWRLAQEEGRGWIYSPNSSSGREHPVCVIQDDDVLIKKYLCKKEFGCTIVIQRLSTGNTQIYANKNVADDFDITAIAVGLRIAEMKKQAVHCGLAIPDDWQVGIDQQGSYRLALCWFLCKNLVLNGSITSPKVRPTLLTIEEILQVISVCFTKIY